MQARAQTDSTTARGNVEASIFQFVKLPDGGLGRAITSIGTDPPIAYTPENRFHPELSTYRHVVATGGIGGRENTQEGINEVTLRWEVPPADLDNPGPLLAVVDPFNSSPEFREISGSVIAVTARYQVTQLSTSPPLWRLELLDLAVNGESVGGGLVFEDVEIPLVPPITFGVAFSQSGSYGVTLTHNDEEIEQTSYLQRALTFEQPFPTFENSQVGDILQFSNRLVWDAGDPTVNTFAPDSFNLPPRWRASIGGFGVSELFPGPTSANWVDGTQISFQWDSDATRFLTRQADALAGFRVLPHGLESIAGRIPEDHQVYTYRVIGEVTTYHVSSTLLRYQVAATGDLRGRDRRVFLEDVVFAPTTVVANESASLSGRIATLDFVDPEVVWSPDHHPTDDR